MASLRESLRHRPPLDSVRPFWWPLVGTGLAAVLPSLNSLPVTVVFLLAGLGIFSLLFHRLDWRLYSFFGYGLTLLFAVALKPLVPGGLLGPAYYAGFFAGLVAFKTFSLRSYGDGILFLVFVLGANAACLLSTPDPSGWLELWALLVMFAALAQLLRLNLRDFSAVSLLASLRSVALGTLYALPLLCVLFYSFQKFSHMQIFEPGESGFVGLTNSLEPGKLERLNQNSAIAFRAQLSREGFLPDSLFWKGPVLTESDQMAWHQGRAEPAEESSAPEARSECLVEQKIFLQETALHSFRLALDVPVHASFHSLGGGVYTARSNLCPAANDQAPTPHRPGPGYLKVNAEETPALSQLVKSLSRGGDGPRAFAAAFAQFLRDGKFGYSLHPPALASRVPLEDFLFRKKVGYCEHFASSLALLARWAGFPSRVVVGYQGGRRNRFGDYWVISDKNAHAWVELWDVQKGWLRFDPTATVAPVDGWARARWFSWASLEDSAVAQGVDAFFFSLRGWLEGGGPLFAWGSWPWRWAGGGIFCVTAFYLWMRRRRPGRNPESAVMRELGSLCDSLARQGFPKGRAEGLAAYRARIREELKNHSYLRPRRDLLDSALARVIEWRYGPRPLDSDAGFSVAAALRAARRKIRPPLLGGVAVGQMFGINKK